MMQLAIDVGGTFTDCLVLDEVGRIQKYKSSTTPDDPTRGFFAAIEKAAVAHQLDLDAFLAQVDLIVHGTTIGTNILLTGRGAKVGLITTQGFRDVTEIRRGIKNLHGSMFDQFVEPYSPLVPRDLRIGVPERTLYTGEITEAVDEEAVREATRRLVDDGCEAVAVCFLHSYANRANEERAKSIVQEVAPDLYVNASYEILPVWREFERFSSTVVSVYIGPAIDTYLTDLQVQLGERNFGGHLLMMLANGLVQVVDQCRERAVYLLGSGPAAAPSGSVRLGEAHSSRDLLSVDMGGTSFDVCVIRDGEIPTTTEAWVGEERVAIKMVDVSSVGVGGGSIAWVDSLGLLRVGPLSAGADPGPAAYGKGDAATVTDADIVLGYVPTDYFLGGEMTLLPERSLAAVDHVATQLGIPSDEAARAIYVTATVLMANEITEVCTKRGFDVRDFTMVAGGGAGGVHAAAIAERLGIPKVIIPRNSALMSAFGMLNMDLGQEFARSRFRDLAHFDPNEVASAYSEMVADARLMFEAAGLPVANLRYGRTVDMRYVGQFHEVEVELPDGQIDADLVAAVEERFHAKHQKLFGYSMPWQPVEFLSFYLRAIDPRPAPELRAESAPGGNADDALRGTRRALLEDGWRELPVFDGDRLRPGHVFEGPALVDDRTTTVLVLESFVCEVDAQHNLVLRSRGVEVPSPSAHATAAI